MPPEFVFQADDSKRGKTYAKRVNGGYAGAAS